MVHKFWNLRKGGIVTICFMYIIGSNSFVLIKVISFVGDGFSYFLLFEHSLRVVGQSCKTGFF